jgi:phosphinothricin acetyltransferase
MIIRDARLADLPAIVDIYNSTIPSRLVTADTELVTVESRLKWFYDHSSGKRPLLVVKINENTEELIGWVSFKDFYGRPAYQHTAELSIYLNASQRNKGLGKYLLEKMMEKAPSYGIHTLLGFIFSHNAPSLRLFQKAGFEQWGFLNEVAILDGIPRSVVIMGKKLG